VSALSARVRSGRSGPTVAVTGAASPVGRAVVAGLAGRVGHPGGPQAVLAVDAAASFSESLTEPSGGSADGVRHLAADLTTDDVRAALDGVDVVVHVACTADGAAEAVLTATARRVRAVRSVQEVATAAAAGGASRFVVVTSAMVYGVTPNCPGPVAEDAAPAARRDDTVLGDLLEVERIVARIPKVHPGLRTTVLRPAALVGPGIDTTITRHLREPRLLALRGEQMRWQFCHVDDLADAVALAIGAELDGVLTAGTLPALTDAEVEGLTGMRRVELPARLAYATAERLRRSRALGGAGADLTYVVHPWVVGAERLTAAGWMPRHDAGDCLRAVRRALPADVAAARAEGAAGAETPAGRRVEPREAALGAAGAAVALLGTAALLRQARARRGTAGRPRL